MAAVQKVDPSPSPAPIPWRRVLGLLRPLRRGIAAMVGLTVAGVLIGLVPPIALGLLVDALVENNDRPEAMMLAGLITLAIILEAAAYVASDGMYARNASRLYRNVRVEMFGGALRRSGEGGDTAGLVSRFISDAETLEQVTMSLIDSGTMLVVEFASALIAVALLQPGAIVVNPCPSGDLDRDEADPGTRRLCRAASPGGTRGDDRLDHARAR